LPARFTFFDFVEAAAPTKERNWVVRHAVRHPAKQGNEAALELRRRAR
jgi:3-methyladenine DNA glycosylase AlkC